MKVQEIIVVEGKNDSANIQKYLDVDTIETHGTHCSKETLQLILDLSKTRGIIVFTDPDSPGDLIRNKINQAVPGCKNAFLASHKARSKRKVGIEHAQKEDILQALDHCVQYDSSYRETLSWQAFNELGLNGQTNSSYKRSKLTHMYHLGEANAKTCFKRLNMLQISKDQILEILRATDE